MKFSLKYIFKYLTSSEFRTSKLVESSGDENQFKPNKHWAKIEKGGSGWLHWTDYTDYDGNLFRMYDLIPDPGFPYYDLNKKENNNDKRNT